MNVILNGEHIVAFTRGDGVEVPEHINIWNCEDYKYRDNTFVCIAKDRLIARVKTIRDARAERGGYLVGGNWFQSDIASKMRHVELRNMGQGLPSGIQWKCMGPNYVEMTKQLAVDICQAGFAKEMALFSFAKSKIDALDAAEDPLSVDIDNGWPLCYQDTQPNLKEEWL